MFDALRARAAGVAGILGGIAWASLPVAIGFSVGEQVAVVAVLLLLFALAGFHSWHRAALGVPGRIGTSLLGTGLFVVLAAAGTTLAGLDGLAGTAALVGLATVAVGSATLGVAAYRGSVLPVPVAAALVVGIPLSLFANATLRALWNGVGVYGLVWTIVGYHLFEDASAELADGGGD